MTKLQNWFYRYNAWSFTKHRLWGQCKRAYYYSYIGTALQGSRDFDVHKLKQLKKLDSRFVLQGKLVHEVLEYQLEQLRLGRTIGEEVAREQYIRGVEQYRKNAKHSLVECFNGQAVGEVFFDRIRENGLDQLSLFFGVIWPQLEDSEYLRHEKFDRFKANDRVKAIVKIDYVRSTEGGNVVISDWKTGTDNPKYESKLQIGAYVLWAVKHYKLEPEQVRSELIYLTTGAIRDYEFSTDELEKIRRLIVSDFEEMNESYDISYFDPHPNPRQCLGCHFASVCSHSMTDEQVNR
jgi:CRISPR/Cas system-associated exonuclease Cas4 (RecB family)